MERVTSESSWTEATAYYGLEAKRNKPKNSNRKKKEKTQQELEMGLWRDRKSKKLVSASFIEFDTTVNKINLGGAKIKLDRMSKAPESMLSFGSLLISLLILISVLIPKNNTLIITEFI